MSEPKFTPGPWRSAPYFPQEWLNNGQKEQGYEVTYGEDKEVVSERIYTKEDAALIAAAPEMYDVLQKLVEWNKKYPSNQDYHSVSEIVKIGDLCNAICKEAEQVLEKASGEE